jgi:hypothetical protein
MYAYVCVRACVCVYVCMYAYVSVDVYAKEAYHKSHGCMYVCVCVHEMYFNSLHRLWHPNSDPATTILGQAKIGSRVLKLQVFQR